MSASRDWNVPDNLPALYAHAHNGGADDLQEIPAGEADQAFLQAAAITHRLGGGFTVGSVRVERSDGWITLGYRFIYRSFVESLSRDRQVPVGDEEPESSIVDPEPVEAVGA